MAVPGLNLIAYEPLSEQGLYAREFIDDLTDNHQQGVFITAAVGGFERANFVLRGTRSYLDDWYDDGILRRIALYNPEAIMIWEGFVSRMRYNAGTRQQTKTVEDYFNRVYLRYAPLDFSVFPPIAGAPQDIIINNISEQNKYGVKAAMVSGGERVDSTALEWAQNILNNRSEMPEGEAVNTLSTTDAFIEIECRGYYHTLKWLPYINQVTGSIQAHQVIQEILEYFNGINPGWIDQTFEWIDYNFRTARRGYDELQSCWDIISQIIREGGKGGERWVGGLYQDRRMTYKQAETFSGLYGEEFDLYRELGDPAQMIFDVATGTEVKPWDMVPDRILHTVDVNVGGDKDLMYIEQVTYREPYGLQLVGGDDERLEVFLAQRGLPAL